MRTPLTRRIAQLAGVLLSVTIFLLAIATLRDILSEVSPQDVIDAFRATPSAAILTSLGFAAASYLAMTGYESLALHHLKKPIPYRRTALASFTSYAVANNMGFAVLTGGSVRYRIYSLEGMSAVDIAVLTAIVMMTFTLGILTALGATLIISPATASAIDRLPVSLNFLLGIVLLTGIAGYIVWVSRRRRRISYKGFRVRLPGPRLTLIQIVIAVSELILAAGALYALLPADTNLPFSIVAVAFIAAIGLGVLSHAPGGIGVFEAVMLLGLPQIPPEQLLASLLMFRCVYYLVPLALAALLLAYHEASHPKGFARRLGNEAMRGGGDLAPQIIGAMMITVGAILVMSGALPAVPARLAAVTSIIPLWLIELSHLLTGLIGLALLILARGVFRRHAHSFRIARMLLFVALLAVLLRGLDLEEAGMILFALLILQSSRRAFYRPGTALSVPFTAPWLAALSGVIVLTIAIGRFVYQDAPAGLGAWATFADTYHYGRFVRTSLVLALAGIGFQAYLVSRRTPKEPPTHDIPQIVRRAATERPDETTHLALTGDKQFLVSGDGQAALAYAAGRTTHVALGPVIGDRTQTVDLLWRLRDLAENRGTKAAVFDIPPDMADACREAGMMLVEIGEAALIDTSIDYSAAVEAETVSALRRDLRRCERIGLERAVIRSELIHTVMAEFVDVAAQASTASAGQRGFAIARFSEDYAAGFDHAIARIGDRIVGFAALSGLGQETAVMGGLFRRPETDRAIVTGLIDVARTDAFRCGSKRLDLGLSPVAGLQDDTLWPVWERIGPGLFPLGGDTKTFQDARDMAGQFQPSWEPRYLASYEGLAIPAALGDTAWLTLGETNPASRDLAAVARPTLKRLKALQPGDIARRIGKADR
ncbi:MAG: phosphatidylglycerol lysyltransferase domain-containing protein [Pseudomonadota bacterium]